MQQDEVGHLRTRWNAAKAGRIVASLMTVRESGKGDPVR